MRLARKRWLAFLLIVAARDGEPQIASAHRIADGDTPLNLVEVEHHWLISSNSGWHKQYLQAYDEHSGRVSSKLDLPSVWYGLAYEPADHTLLASSGADSVYAVAMDQGRFGAVRKMHFDGCKVAAGVEIQNADKAWLACNQSQGLIHFNPATGATLANVPMDGFPYAIRNLPERRIAVSLWGKSAVAILSADGTGPISFVNVGRHPNDMLVLAEKNLLLVTCSDSDDVSWIDLRKPAEIRRSHIQTPGRGLTGAQPNALAADPSSGRIFVALAAVNAIAVLTPHPGRDLERSATIIPVAAGYPTALLYSTEARTLFVADARNLVTGPNGNAGATKSKFPAIGSLIGGAIESFGAGELSRLTALKTLQEQIYGGEPGPSGVEKSLISHFTAKRGSRSPIQHVFYILKENRTYDQLFGDIREGNGSPELTLFGADVTPNQRELAREFVLFDNFLVDGDVSADGHLWSMAATSTDYVNKFWPSNYSHLAEGVFDGPYDGDPDHDQPIAAPGSGFIWDRARKLNISYRDYGEWGVSDPADPHKNVIYLAGLKGHYDPYYRDEIGDVSDQQRADEWLKEFRAFQSNGNLPQLTIIHLPNDHTVGTQVGYPTPRAMIADNDLALGRMVEAITRSRFWPESIIFVLEDDAQDGPDHVDCHRSPLLVISPFVRRHAVEHRRFTTASVLKTIEQILGMGSLTYFDDRARSLLVDFQSEPVMEPYTVRQPAVSLDEKNTADSPGAKQSSRWDFHRVDRAPARDLNEVIWQSVRGAASSQPAPIHEIPVPTPSKGLHSVTLR